MLVTGGAGFIGSHLVDRLLESGYTVRVLDDFSSGQMKNIDKHLGKKSFYLTKGSINDPKALKDAMSGVDTVFHLAAIISVLRSLEDPKPIEKVNVDGTLSVLEEARRRDVQSVVFASSAAVYGDKSKPPLKEDSPLAPISPYGSTKVSGESYCDSFFHSYGLGTVVLRFFNAYGTRRSPGAYSGVMMRFAENSLKGKPLTIFGDGKQSRDFVHVDDVVQASVLAAKNKEARGKIFNVGTGRPTTVLELSSLFMAQASSRSRGVVHSDAIVGDIRQSWASIARAKASLGYRPKVRLESGLQSFIRWYANEYHFGRSVER